KTNILSVIMGRLFGIQVVTTLHGYVTRGGRLETYYQLDRLALRFVDHAVAVSPDLFQFLTEVGISRFKSSLVENAIDTEQFRRTRTVEEAKTNLGIKPKNVLIGAVGRLSPEKGFDVLIRSVDQ